MIRQGRVHSIDPVNMTARVLFEDMESLPSAPLRILVPFSLGDCGYWLPKVNTQVAVCMLSNGPEYGFIMGAFYSEVDMPKESSASVTAFHFEDGTQIRYDSQSSELQVNVKGKIIVQAADSIDIKTVGSISISAGGHTQFKGNISVAGDVVANGVSLTSHKHSGVQSGGSNTAGPVGGA